MHLAAACLQRPSAGHPAARDPGRGGTLAAGTPAGVAWKRGWHELPLVSSVTGDDGRDHNAIDDQGDEEAARNVFTRGNGVARHSWAGEMARETADPGQRPRGAPGLMPLWAVLDNTPEGRARDWPPRLHD